MMNGYIKIIIATILFSLNPLLFKLLNLDALNILWSVNLIAVIALVIKIKWERRTKDLVKFDKGALTLLALGLFFTINNSLFIFAIKTTTIANAILTHYLAPIFILIFGILLIKEKITKTSILALLLSLLGLVIMLSPNELTLSNIHFLGLIFGTLSAIFFALEILLKKILTKFCAADMIVARYLLISVILLIPFISFSKIITVGIIGLVILIGSGLIGSALGITLFTSGLKDVRAQHAGIISYLEPFGAILFGFLIIAEIPAIETLIGGSLILLGTYIILRYKSTVK